MNPLLVCSVAALLTCAAGAQTQAPRTAKFTTKTLPTGETVVVDRLKVTLREGSAKLHSLDARGKAKAVPLAALSALHPDIINITGGHTSSRAWLKGAELPQKVRKAGSIPRIARNFTVELRPGADVAAVRAALQQHPDVERVDFKELLPMSSVPNDPDYSRQWAPKAIGLESAWDVPGRGHVRVAVIDSGLRLAHPDFAGRVVFHDGYADFDTGEAPASGLDFDHGTHVAGIIAATRNNSQFVAGYSNDIDLMILNCASWGFNSEKNADGWLIGDADDAMDDAVANGASVINCSFGFGSGIEDEVVDAYNAGVLVVHAAGNLGINISSRWESSSIALLTVTATMNNAPAGGSPVDVFDAGYSNFGPGVDLAAPGSAIFSTVPNGADSFFGTSMAAPQVSGAAALIMSMNPNGTYGHLAARALLIRMAEDKGSTGYDEQYGYGALRLSKSVLEVLRAANLFVKGNNHPTSVPQQTGSFDAPFQSFDAALAAAPSGSVLVLNGGVTSPPDFHLSEERYALPAQPLTKPCTLLAIPDRPVVIGP